jgi:hypothetical protein
MKFWTILSIFILFFSHLAKADTLSYVTKTEVTKAAANLKDQKMKWVLVPKIKDNKKPSIDDSTLKNFGLMGQVFKLFAIALIICFALILIYLIFKDIKFSNSKINAPDIELDHIQDITSIDFEAILKEALANKDFRLATRIQYLTMLQQLQNKQKIVWKPNKTNRAYSAELAESNLGTPFKVLSSLFEKIWYGHADVNEEQYSGIYTQFESMQKLI